MYIYINAKIDRSLMGVECTCTRMRPGIWTERRGMSVAVHALCMRILITHVWS